jgi:hypothetical protein
MIKDDPEEFKDTVYTRQQMLQATEQLTAVRKAVYKSFKDKPEEKHQELLLRES